MRLVPLTTTTWDVFRSWFPIRIPPPTEAILVADTIDGQEYLLGGACIYPAGPYVLFEHFALNPQAPLRMKHEVAEQIFKASKAYATIHGKVAFAWVNFDGGAKMLGRLGFYESPAKLMVFSPFEETAAAPAAPAAKGQTREEAIEETEDEDDFDPDDDGDMPTPARRTEAPKKKATKRRAKRLSLA